MIPHEQRSKLRALAAQSISYGLEHGSVIKVELNNWPRELQEYRSSFITLHKHGELRGCIGSLEASVPLVTDIAKHAYAAAFRDPRFSPVEHDELEYLNIHLSVLSQAETINCDSEQALIAALRPRVDGLTISDGNRQATFLPSVWESLPQPGEFLGHLKQKAGFSKDYWAPSIKAERYTTESW